MGVRRNKGAARNAKAAGDAAEAPPPPVPATPLPALACCFKDQADRDSLPEDFHGHVPGHPESPGRVASCVERLRSHGLLRSFRRLPQRLASDAELLLCHSAEHVAGLEKLARLAAGDAKTRFVPTDGVLCMGGPCCEVREGREDADTYVNPGSLQAARLAAGGVMQIVDEVMTEECSTRCGLALCRPPGHHASRTRSQGFCLVNNVAVAAAYARSQYPEVERVLIFDWDVHHGQGTQQIFDQSSDVLTLSIHRHDGEKFYPATGGAREVGIGTGRGYSVNVPLPGGYGDAALWAACAEVLAPAARQFQPQLIIVSAGFDAAAGDPLGGCTVSTRFFGVLTTELRRLARELSENRLVLALEGGYNVSVLEDCVEEVARALVAEAPEGMAFAESPPWPLEGSSCYGAIRRTCEAHQSLPLRLRPPPSKSDRRKAAGHSSRAASADGGEAGGTAAAVRALGAAGAAAIRGLGRFAGLGGAGSPTALEASLPEAGEDVVADSAAATAEAAVSAVERATGDELTKEPMAAPDVAENAAGHSTEATAEAVQDGHGHASPTRKSKNRRKAQKKAEEAAQAAQGEDVQEERDSVVQLDIAASQNIEPATAEEALEPEGQWTAPRQRRRRNGQPAMAAEMEATPAAGHEAARPASAAAATSSRTDASPKAVKPATAANKKKAVNETVPATAASSRAELRNGASPRAAAPATGTNGKKAASDIDEKVAAPLASPQAEPRNVASAKATASSKKKAANDSVLPPKPPTPDAAPLEQKAANDIDVKYSAHTADDKSEKNAVAEVDRKMSQPVTSKVEPRTTPAKICPDPAPINAVCEIQPDSLLVRLSPVQRPKDIAVSTDELWIWFELDAATNAIEATPQLRRWRFEGVRVDNSGALRSAEFRAKRKELTLNLVLGPILGGAVLLTPLSC